MIKKIIEIKNLAVFDDFNWDASVRDKDGYIVEFKEINIIYGRNYSGKTTLSRIVRAFETGKISDKYLAPGFKLLLSDSSSLSEGDITSHNLKFRVFNEDFIKENLKFIANPEDSIEPFAILGEENNRIEEEIKVLEGQLGSKEEGSESGLYEKLKQENDCVREKFGEHQTKGSQLEQKLTTKATDRTVGIKHKPEKFGDQNYNRTKLQTDIETVLSDEYTPIRNDEQNELETLTSEKVNPIIQAYPTVITSISNLQKEAKILVEKKVGQSDKIEELIKDAVLNRWVNQGRELHKDKRTVCGFCSNQISEERWLQLDKHFDEESMELEKDIEELLKKVEDEEKLIQKGFNPNASLFYSKFHSKIERLINMYEAVSKQYVGALGLIKLQLQSRKNNLISPSTFFEVGDYSRRLQFVFSYYEKLRTNSNLLSTNLISEQNRARTKLRLKEVYDFVTTIQYEEEIDAIEQLKEKLKEAEDKRDVVLNEINTITEEIKIKQNQLKDESLGALKVNQYLNNFFGNGFLTLEAREVEGNETESKRYRFEVLREGHKAYHMSEGECSLIAFCYFMAKLDDINTRGVKPIIWIDDPISSLDSNHVFFVYSLIKVEIVKNSQYEQLFVSTHNLDFFKYLKRLINPTSKKKKFFVVHRKVNTSDIMVMPDYLKNYVSEFNYLFHQIYKCANIEDVDDNNYHIIYNFGNNARKFLEIYLCYRYPDGVENDDKLKKFFGDEDVPAILGDRVNNEYSHLSGSFERGARPVEVPEMNKVAQSILIRLQEDQEQYKAFLKSIGIETLAEEIETI